MGCHIANVSAHNFTKNFVLSTELSSMSKLRESTEDYEDMDTTKMNSQDPIVQLPNGKLVLFSGFSVVRRLSLA